jgi:hypothetical protein
MVRYVAAGVSVAFHALVILLYAVSGSGWGPMTGAVSLDSSASVLEGMKVVRIIELETEDPSADAPLEEVELEVEVPAPTVQFEVATGPVETEEAEGEDPVSAAEVLRVRVTDARLWTVARPDLLELTNEERMRLQLAGRLEAWNDSVAAVRAAAADMLDWTTTDSQGNKWGVSPGKLHLGNLTLPLPFSFGPNPWQAEQYARRLEREQDIAAHATDQAVRASWKERAEAIRRRKDREKAEEEEAKAEAKPDTTSSRRRGGGRKQIP